VIAALNLGAVLLGVAAGGLTSSIIGFGLAAILTVFGLESGADIGLVVGVVSGLALGGWVAGSRSRHSQRFHGAVTGLLLAFLIMVIAVLGGSPASTLSIIWLAFVAILVSGVCGWLAGRRTRNSL
jgi:putative membrane protein (TIGR04086 family)